MSRRWPVITLVMGLAGTGLFFPMKLGSHETNPFQFFFEKDTWSTRSPEDAVRCALHHTSGNSVLPREAGRNVQPFLLRRYLFPYAFLWWLSLALVGWSMNCLTRRHPKSPSTEIKWQREESET